jgi:hypothetical protein
MSLSPFCISCGNADVSMKNVKPSIFMLCFMSS